MTAERRSYTSGHFELQIDGHSSTAYLKSVEGGHVSAATIDEAVGAENVRVKHISTVDIEPISVEFGLAGAKDILKWIANSWDRKFMRRNGQITHADFNLKSQLEHHFIEALIQETTFPTLDGSSKEAAYLKMKFQPEHVTLKDGRGAALSPSYMGDKQQMWLPSAFRFNLEGMDSMRFTNKIESFTIKQGIKKAYDGKNRYPQIEPTKIEFPVINGTIALEYAKDLLKWHDDYVVHGRKKDQAGQLKHGSIEFLSPDRKTTIFEIVLKHVGISKAAIEASKANAETIKRVSFSLFVESMSLNPDSLGLES